MVARRVQRGYLDQCACCFDQIVMSLVNLYHQAMFQIAGHISTQMYFKQDSTLGPTTVRVKQANDTC